MSGHLPAVSRILRKCLSGTEIYLGLFLRDSTKLPVSYNVFCIFFKFFCSSHGSTKLVPISSCRQPVFGINSPKLLYLCTFSPIHSLCCHSRELCFLVCFRGHILEVFGYCQQCQSCKYKKTPPQSCSQNSLLWCFTNLKERSNSTFHCALEDKSEAL